MQCVYLNQGTMHNTLRQAERFTLIFLKKLFEHSHVFNYIGDKTTISIHIVTSITCTSKRVTKTKYTRVNAH